MPHLGTPDDVDPKIRLIINQKIRELARRGRVHPQDRADLEQSLLLRFLEQQSKFDPQRGVLEVFAAVVLSNALANSVRDESTRKRRPRFPTVTLESMDSIADPHGERDEQRRDLALDVAEWLARLPAQYRELAEQLKKGPLAAAARALQKPRTTLYGPLATVQAEFERAQLRDYLP